MSTQREGGPSALTLPQPPALYIGNSGPLQASTTPEAAGKKAGQLLRPPQIAAGCVLPLAEMLGFETYFVKWSAVIMSGFVVAFMVAIVVALRIFNFQKR